MNRRGPVWLIFLLIFFSIYFIMPKVPANPSLKIFNNTYHLNDALGKFPLKLGLDLQGGTQLVLEAKMDAIAPSDRDNALQSAREVIERRVNLFGVSESVVQTSKLGEQRRILVDLPGVTDASAAASLVGRTAQLEFHEIPATNSAEATASADPYGGVPTGLTGADLKSATVVFNQSSNGQPAVSIEFTPEGAKKFDQITDRDLGKPLLILLDNQFVSAPTIQAHIVDGKSIITGQFTTDQAKQLAVQLNAGALPVPIKILEQRSIGATLGQESIEKSLIAGAIGLLIIMVYMVAFYGWLGLIADIALIIYALFNLAIYRTGLFILPPITLTLAGIAGFILSIGMAVDANILIFERLKEERRWGKSFRVAVDLGFKRAWTSIRDSNISSIITAVILYTIGTGPVKGFAVTLAIGVLVSMFTAITVTRTILRMVIK